MEVESVSNVKILVIGDIMLDRYVVGEVERISPEAPVPIVRVTEEYSTLGGCGNVARNIKSMGAKVDCIASIGNDSDGEVIESGHFEKLNIGNYLIKKSRRTSVKERIVANSRKIQMIRVDREDIMTVDPWYVTSMLDEYFKDNLPHMIVISDYAKGIVSRDVINYLGNVGTRIILDPKPINSKFYNKHFYITTPNEKEWHEMKVAPSISDYVLITKGKHGMTLTDFNEYIDIPAEEIHNVFNVSGAGDTVVAALSICSAMGLSPLKSAKIANACSGYVVTQPGTSVVKEDMFKDILRRY